MTKRRSPWLRLTALLIYGFLYAPILVLIIFAFNASRTNIIFKGVIAEQGPYRLEQDVVQSAPCGPFHWFCQLPNNRELVNAARNTLVIAFTSTLAATIIGTMAALALQRYHFPLKTFSEVSLYIPIVIPEIVMGISVLTLFSAVFSYLNTALPAASRLSLGLGTVIVSHIAFSVPFVALVVRARLHGFDRSVEEAAMDLGANEWITFWRVTLPLIAPGVLSGALLAFTLSLDDFIITFFTTGPGATTLPIYVYGLLRRITTPELNALSTLWILIVFTALSVSQLLQRRSA
ncbi:MAG: ABC transporter permease [Anaerolineales bacterium]|nr:ABC transporter permease [Anaerolineales bacterium]